MAGCRNCEGGSCRVSSTQCPKRGGLQWCRWFLPCSGLRDSGSGIRRDQFWGLIFTLTLATLYLDYHSPPFLRECVCSRKRPAERYFLPVFLSVCLALNNELQVKASEAWGLFSENVQSESQAWHQVVSEQFWKTTKMVDSFPKIQVRNGWSSGWGRVFQPSRGIHRALKGFLWSSRAGQMTQWFPWSMWESHWVQLWGRDSYRHWWRNRNAKNVVTQEPPGWGMACMNLEMHWGGYHWWELKEGILTSRPTPLSHPSRKEKGLFRWAGGGQGNGDHH